MIEIIYFFFTKDTNTNLSSKTHEIQQCSKIAVLHLIEIMANNFIAFNRKSILVHINYKLLLYLAAHVKA